MEKLILCLELSSVDHMSFNSKPESYTSDDALDKLDFAYQTIDTGYEENKNKNNEENDHINNHSLEAKSTFIQKLKLFKPVPRLVAISRLKQSTEPIDVLSDEQLSKPIISPEAMYKFLDLSSKFYYSSQILLMAFNYFICYYLLIDDEIKFVEEQRIILPSHFPITKVEEIEAKRIRRKIKNRISAHISRKRKKQYIDDLEAR